MKKNIIFLSFVAMVVLLASCHKDPIELPVGTINLKLVKAYKSNSMSKGMWDSFSANVIILYEGGDSTLYECIFADPSGVGIYSNDIVSGDRIYLRRGEGFRIKIEANIDGEDVYGDSGPTWLFYSDETGSLDIEIELLAGKTRIGIYQPRTDEVFGSFAIAKGEIIEIHGDAQIEECGIMCVPQSMYESLGADANERMRNFTLESENQEYIINIDETFDFQSGSRKYTVMLQNLTPNTEYFMRAFAYCHADTTEPSFCYSRVVSFTTKDRDSTQLYLINNDIRVYSDSADISARIIMLSGTVDDVECGLCLSSDGSSYGLSVNDAERTYPGVIDASDNGTNGIVSVLADELQPGTSYRYKFYAIYNNSFYYSGESVFRTSLNPENINVITSDPRNQIETGSSAILYGELIESAGCTISERGFKYGFFSADNATVPAVEDLGSSVIGSSLSGGQFSASVSLPITVKRLYYVAYVKEESGFVKYGEVKSVNVRPENVPVVSASETEYTTYSMSVHVNIETHGYQCKCGILYTEMDTASLIYGGSNLNTSSLVNVVSDGMFTVRVTGLRPGTRYSYRAFVLVGDEVIHEETTSEEIYTKSLGQEGHNGGIIFYSGSNFELEAFFVDTVAEWGKSGGYAITVETPSGSGVVSGKTNTESIIQFSASYDSIYAAYECYRLGGYLPSTSEMMELARFATSWDGGEDFFFEQGYYWTSDEYDENNAVSILIDDAGRATTIENRPKSDKLMYVPIMRY